jgi:environmental stress-induced protein Ves
MIALEPRHYQRRPWKNGLGESLEIAAEPAGASYDRLLWSFSSTGFTGSVFFSDLPGFDRIITLTLGAGLVLKAWDEGADLKIPLLSDPVAFDGGRVLEGIADGGVQVLNLMARQARVQIAMAYLGAEPRDFVADTVLVHACQGPVELDLDAELLEAWAVPIHDPDTGFAYRSVLPGHCTLRFDGEPVRLAALSGAALVASITRLAA